VVLSAFDDDALREYAMRLRRRLSDDPDLRLDDIAFTLAYGRTALSARTGLLVESVAQLGDCLDAFILGEDDHEHRDAEVVRRWLAGEDVAEDVGDLSAARRVPLPSHPFRRIRHWVDGPPSDEGVRSPSAPEVGDGQLVDRVCAVIESRLGQPVGSDDDIHELGVDSLMAVEVVTALRDELNATLAVDDVSGARTPCAIAELIGAAGGSRAIARAQPSSECTANRERSGAEGVSGASAQGRRFGHLLTRISGDDAASDPVFLVHPAGGTTICYADLARQAGRGRPLYGIGFPTEAATEFSSIRDLARLYAELVRDARPSGPYTIGGYSFGGNVAFEMALLLEAAGESVEQVIMFDSHPPEAYIGREADERDFLDAFPILLRAVLPDVDVPAGLSPASVRDALEAIRRPSWSDGMLEELERFFAVWRHNHAALKRYYPDGRLQADVAYLAASVPQSQQIDTRLAIRRVPSESWRNHMAGQFTSVSVPGDHYSMFRDPENLRVLAAEYGRVVEGTEA
jgi:thioesterase domain-containing protein